MRFSQGDYRLVAEGAGRFRGRRAASRAGPPASMHGT